ncbi:MAG: hypothetical protein HYR91_08300 [Flavobacteriia bacterium]|nr:hypothetical protein [Flavobacteriia bacterium]
MTKEEAYLFFSFTDEDELEEVYEQQLFDYKQFFISKNPIRKVFRAKVQKMKKMHEAYLLLEGEEANEGDFEKISFSFESKTIEDTFNHAHFVRNQFKQKIQFAKSARELEFIISNYIEFQTKYLQSWIEIDLENDETVLVSKEPDVMGLLKAIRSCKEIGIRTFVDLKEKAEEKNENIFLKMLLMEAKRLSLLRKMELNE